MSSNNLKASSRTLKFICRHLDAVFLSYGSLIIGCFMIMGLLKGGGFWVSANDQLDSEVMYYWLKANNGITASSFDNFMNGRAFVQVPCIISLLFYKLLPPVYAFIVNRYIVTEIGFVGMYLLLNTSRIEKPVSFISAMLFSAIPFFSVYGLTVMGIPLIACCFIWLYQRKWLTVSYITVAIFALYSAFLLSGFAVCGVLMLMTVVLTVKDKKLPKHFLIGLVILIALYIVINLDIIKVQFFGNSSFISHRSEIIKNPIPLSSFFNDYIKDAFYNIHAMSSHVGFLVMYLLACGFSLFYFIFDKPLKNRILLFIISALSLLAILAFAFSVVSAAGISIRQKLFGSSGMASFAFERVTMLAPAFWHFLFAVAVSIVFNGMKQGIEYLFNSNKSKEGALGTFLVRTDKHKLTVLTYVITALLLIKPVGYVISHSELLNEVRSEEDNINAGFVPWDRFFEPDIFDEIKAEIGSDLENNRVISVGLYPSIALFNGLFCLDGYSNYYDLEYKHNFEKIIESELDKSETIRDYFLYWGNRCYAFSADAGRNYLPMYNFMQIELDYDIEAFKELGGRYVLSAYEITNAQELKLELVKTVSTDKSYYKIFLYRTEQNNDLSERV